MPSAEGVATYDATCTIPKSDFFLGDTVCVKASGVPSSLFPWRINWVDPGGFIRQSDSASTDDTTQYTYTIPSENMTEVNGTVVDNRGSWRVNLTRPNGAVRQTARFVVHEQANPQADVFVQKFQRDISGVHSGENIAFIIQVGNAGPDPSVAVHLTDSVPSGATLVSFNKNAGPDCVPVEAGGPANDCVITAMTNGDVAEFTVIYNLGSNAPGTYTTSATASNTTSIDNNNDPIAAIPDPNPDNNTSTAEFTIQAGSSNTACSLTCPTSIETTANTTENGQRGRHVDFDAAEGTGDCGAITADPPSGSFFPVGTTTVTVTSERGDGSCTFTVTVEDTTGNVTISCPPDKTANANSDCAATVDAGTPATTGDNVTVTSSRSDGLPLSSPYPAGTTTITWTAYSHATPGPYATPEDEEADRTGSASCTQTVTVTDVTPPVIAPMQDQTASADASCQAIVPDYTGSAAVSDNCACAESDTSPACQDRGRITVTQDPAPGTSVGLGSHTIKLTANDGSSNPNAGPDGVFGTGDDGTGNESSTTFTLTVNDTTAPQISCPADITRSSDAGSCSATIDPGTATATDNCDSSPDITGTRSDNQPLNAPYPKGTTTITWTATDDSTNSASCTQTVTVNDTEAPTVSCPANVTTGTDPGSCTAIVNPAASATDNCDSNLTATGTRSDGQPLDAPYPKGTTIVTWSATDSSGNHSESCTQTITVNDTEAPKISCPADITRSTDPDSCTATINPGTATATDNCDTPIVVGTRSDGLPLNAPYPKGTTTITWTATDTSTNHAECTQTITVNDTQAPAISCPANVVADTEPGTCSAHVNPGTATASDNCGSATVAGTRSDGQPLNATYPKGTTTITWTATDGSGNQTSCSQTVTVRDHEAPTITTNGQTPALWPANHAYRTFNVTDFVTGVSDNCDALGISSVVIDKVTSDEIENGNGDGDTLNDIVIASDCKSVQLRAERENNGDGRVYTITFRITDSSGNVGTKTAQVRVPKNRGVPVVDSGPHYTVTGTCP